MRKNLPVTGVEVLLRDETMIVSRTNLKGIIEYANRDFIEISGFTEAELIGAPHNLVRHPDMPEEAFADFWTTLKSGRPWTGLVKNRCKNGDHYWVEANATPLRENGKVVGYMSVRFKPGREQVAQAEQVYRRFREKQAQGLRIRHGAVVRNTPLAMLSRFTQDLSLRTGGVLLAALIAGIAAIAPWLVARGASLYPVMAVVALLAFVVAWLPQWRLLIPLRRFEAHLLNMSEGRFREHIEDGREDEIGRISDALRSLQIRLGFDLAEARRATEEAMRIKVGLDNVATNVMIVDGDSTIIYLNRSMRGMLAAAEAEIRADLPSFDARQLVGKCIDVFDRVPSLKRESLAALTQAHEAEVLLGGRVFHLTVVPVTDDRGVRLGTAVEWVDHTAEAAVEEEVHRIVQAAGRGDFSQRIGLDGKRNFFLALATGINQLLDACATGLGETAQVLAALSSGDLTAQMRGRYEGTFAELQRDLNHTAAELRKMVGEIGVVVEQIHRGAEEVAQGNMDLSRRTEQAAANLEETAASAEQLTATVKRNAEHAHQAQQIVRSTRELVNDTGAIVSRVVSTMRGIDQSSGRIAEIVSLIDGIAFQTNILALNAAVEAARAGEQGRGFAVVASEVRSLAQKCAAAAKDVKALIEQSTEGVAAGTAQVDEAGSRIGQVIDAVQKVEDLTNEINSASREQASGVDQVARTVIELDETTQRNAALVQQTSASAASMEDQARRLSELVSAFRVDASPAGPMTGRAPAVPVRRPQLEKHSAAA